MKRQARGIATHMAKTIVIVTASPVAQGSFVG